jgi:hypothetical protein
MSLAVSFGTLQTALKAFFCMAGIVIVYLHMPAIESQTSEFFHTRGDSWPSSISSLLPERGIMKIMRELYGPLIPAFDQSWTDPNGHTYDITNETAIWTKPLGSDVLILDVDSRIGTEKTEFGKKDFNFEKADGIAVGALNHYMYGKLNAHPFFPGKKNSKKKSRRLTVDSQTPWVRLSGHFP